MSATGSVGERSFRPSWWVGPLVEMPASERAAQILKSAGSIERADLEFYEWQMQYPRTTKVDRDYRREVQKHLAASGVAFL